MPTSTGYLQLHCVYTQPFRSLYLICEDCMGCRLPNGRRGRPFAISLNGERDEARLGSAAASHIPACAATRCLRLGRGMAEPFSPFHRDRSRRVLGGWSTAQSATIRYSKGKSARLSAPHAFRSGDLAREITGGEQLSSESNSTTETEKNTRRFEPRNDPLGVLSLDSTRFL